jgi:hypothetical protein
MLQQANSNKLFENVPVCINCMRLYQFLFELYSRIEDAAEMKNMDLNKQEPSSTRYKNTMFLGLDPKLNEKVIAILKRQLDRMSKLQKTNRTLSNTRPMTPNSRHTSINQLTETRYSNEEL